jgi:hypothetical protein
VKFQNAQCNSEGICTALLSLVGKALGDNGIGSLPIITLMTKTEQFPRTLASNPISMPLIALQGFNAVTRRECIEPKITLSLCYGTTCTDILKTLHGRSQRVTIPDAVKIQF